MNEREITVTLENAVKSYQAATNDKTREILSTLFPQINNRVHILTEIKRSTSLAYEIDHSTRYKAEVLVLDHEGTGRVVGRERIEVDRDGNARLKHIPVKILQHTDLLKDQQNR